MDTTNTSKVPRATKPLAVGKINRRTVLLYSKPYNKSITFHFAGRNKDGGFSLGKKNLNFISKRGRHRSSRDYRQISFSQIGQEQIFCLLQKSHLLFAHNHSSRGWQSNFLQVIEPKKAIKGPGVIVGDYLFEGKYVLIHGHGEIKLNASTRLDLWPQTDHTILSPRYDMFDNGKLTPVLARKIDQGILVLYSNHSSGHINQTVSIGAALLASDDPGQVLWRSETALFSLMSTINDDLSFLGGHISVNTISLYYHSQRYKLNRIRFANPFADLGLSITHTRLVRHHQNPLMSPRDNGWESVGVFNPAVLQDRDGKVHILYRALNHAGISYLGYASSEDGFHIDQRSDQPAYWPREEWEGACAIGPGWSAGYASGGGWGGCEDPKLTELDGIVYLTYVAHNGWGPPRIALSQISIEDFIAQNWQAWSKPRLISEPGVVNKSGVILPEKIAGQYVVFHRVFPNILIDYRDDLDFNAGDRWLNTKEQIPIRPHAWDSRKLSIGATPIRIRDGWLVIYHAVDDRDARKYKIGAMILDAKNPHKVLYRTNKPILTPDADYENDWKFGVAYPSGAAIKDGTLLVYYGGGDKYVCVATANLERFVADLKTEQDISLQNYKVRLVNS